MIYETKSYTVDPPNPVSLDYLGCAGDRLWRSRGTTTVTHTAAESAMAPAPSRVTVADFRIHRTVTGRLRRVLSGAAGSRGGRVERRAVGPRLRIYFVYI